MLHWFLYMGICRKHYFLALNLISSRLSYSGSLFASKVQKKEGWPVTNLIFLSHTLASFTMPLIQIARHAMAALTVVVLQLSQHSFLTHRKRNSEKLLSFFFFCF